MEHPEITQAQKRLPPWLRKRLRAGERLPVVKRLVSSNKLHTVCQSAACPNRTECWNAGTATFMILGNICTRTCGFCNVPKGIPKDLDQSEPVHVANAVSALQLKYAVITSVTRDDIADGGAGIFAGTIAAIRAQSPSCRVEVLSPDFKGSETDLRSVLDAKPDVLNHNLETVPSRYPHVRPQAAYRTSLKLLSKAAACGAVTKTGLMVGLGEQKDELLSVLREVADAGCAMLTIGQYLQPSKKHVPVEKYYDPDEFEELQEIAHHFGFQSVAAGPLVRSSYHAERYGQQCLRGE